MTFKNTLSYTTHCTLFVFSAAYSFADDKIYKQPLDLDTGYYLSSIDSNSMANEPISATENENLADGETIIKDSSDSDVSMSNTDTKEEEKTWKQKLKLDVLQDNVAKTWQSDKYELYIPFNIWHNRLLYDDRVDEYNEVPLGLGIGKYRYDEKGNWHALYAMIFEDSNEHPEPFFGYGYEKRWGKKNGLSYGLGFTLSITSREEVGYGIPIPVALPIASINYKRLTVQTSYLPGTYNSGNILFTWAKIRFSDDK